MRVLWCKLRASTCLIETLEKTVLVWRTGQNKVCNGIDNVGDEHEGTFVRLFSSFESTSAEDDMGYMRRPVSTLMIDIPF